MQRLKRQPPGLPRTLRTDHIGAAQTRLRGRLHCPVAVLPPESIGCAQPQRHRGPALLWDIWGGVGLPRVLWIPQREIGVGVGEELRQRRRVLARDSSVLGSPGSRRVTWRDSRGNDPEAWAGSPAQFHPTLSSALEELPREGG